MTLSYLVSTAGHAQAQNELYPHNVGTIVQLLQDGAEEFGDEKVVGFTSMLAGDAWTCDTFCELNLGRRSFDTDQCQLIPSFSDYPIASLTVSIPRISTRATSKR
jgi:hypothetical protein